MTVSRENTVLNPVRSGLEGGHGYDKPVSGAAAVTATCRGKWNFAAAGGQKIHLCYPFFNPGVEMQDHFPRRRREDAVVFWRGIDENGMGMHCRREEYGNQDGKNDGRYRKGASY